MSLLRYASTVLFAGLVFYGSLIGLSYLAFPTEATGDIDSARARSSIYATEPKYIAFRLDALDHPGKRVIFIGGSTVREGFRPPQLKARLGNIEVDNLALGSSEMHESAEVVHFVYANIPRESWPEVTFVLGIWYGMFVSAAQRWPDGITDLDVELLRFGLYRRTESGFPVPRLSRAWLPVSQAAVRPLLLASWIYDNYVLDAINAARVFVLRLAGEEPLYTPAGALDRMVLTPRQREVSLSAWRQYMGPSDELRDQSREFLELARLISANGSRLVLLDLPLPAWHRDGVPYSADYRHREESFIPLATSLPGVTYLSMQDGFTDDDFYDSAHPRPRVTGKWADRAATAILPVLP